MNITHNAHSKINAAAAAAAKSLQSCPTLCDPIDGNLPGSPVPGILPKNSHTKQWTAKLPGVTGLHCDNSSKYSPDTAHSPFDLTYGPLYPSSIIMTVADIYRAFTMYYALF